MTLDERKEWENLCRLYNVDSLYEAIDGCQEEIDFLTHCAERLEPREDDDGSSRPRRLTVADLAVSPQQTTPFFPTRPRRSSADHHCKHSVY